LKFLYYLNAGLHVIVNVLSVQKLNTGRVVLTEHALKYLDIIILTSKPENENACGVRMVYHTAKYLLRYALIVTKL
jgi:hypothetical protein